MIAQLVERRFLISRDQSSNLCQDDESLWEMHPHLKKEDLRKQYSLLSDAEFANQFGAELFNTMFDVFLLCILCPFLLIEESNQHHLVFQPLSVHIH